MAQQALRNLELAAPLKPGDHSISLQQRQDGYRWHVQVLETAIEEVELVRITFSGPRHPLPSSAWLSNARICPLAYSGAGTELEEACVRKRITFWSAMQTARRAYTLEWTDTPVLSVHDVGFEQHAVYADTPHQSYVLLSDGGVMHSTQLDNEAIHIGLDDETQHLSHKNGILYPTSPRHDDATYSWSALLLLSQRTENTSLSDRPARIPGYQPTSSPQRRGPTRATGILHALQSEGTWSLGTSSDGGGCKQYKQRGSSGVEMYVGFAPQLPALVAAYAELTGAYPSLWPRAWQAFAIKTMRLPMDTLAMLKKHNLPYSAVLITLDGMSEVMLNAGEDGQDAAVRQCIATEKEAGRALGALLRPLAIHQHPDYLTLKNHGAICTLAATGEEIITVSSTVRTMQSIETLTASPVDVTSKAGAEWWEVQIEEVIDRGFTSIFYDTSDITFRDGQGASGNELKSVHECDRAHSFRPNGDHARRSLDCRTLDKSLRGIAIDMLRGERPVERALVSSESLTLSSKTFSFTSSKDHFWRHFRDWLQQTVYSSARLATRPPFNQVIYNAEQGLRYLQAVLLLPHACLDLTRIVQDVSPSALVKQLLQQRYEMLPFWCNLDWQAHLFATPQACPLFWSSSLSASIEPKDGSVASFTNDQTLYSAGAMSSNVQYWLGVGQLLVACQTKEAAMHVNVYFPRADAELLLYDPALPSSYFSLHEPYSVHRAGSWDLVDTPLEHAAVFAREGAVIPLGHPYATRAYHTPTSEDPSHLPPDDWRGVALFPRPEAQCTAGATYSYRGSWREDDGVSAFARWCKIRLSYWVGNRDRFTKEGCRSGARSESESSAAINVEAVMLKADDDEQAFTPLWGDTLHVLLPRGDGRTVANATRTTLSDGRSAFAIKVKGGTADASTGSLHREAIA